jgi:glucose uptake protein
MYIPSTFAAALVLTVFSTVCWGSWANAFKGTRGYSFPLFYWDYIAGMLLCFLALAFTFGSFGGTGEPFAANIAAADYSNWAYALLAGFIFNLANLLLVAAVEIAGLAIAFPIAIGIALVEGVVVSYWLQPKGSVAYLAAGVALALIAVLFDARAYRLLRNGTQYAPRSRGIAISIASGLLMGTFAPFVARAMTHAHALGPYSVGVLFGAGVLLSCLFANTYLMRRPLHGAPVSFREYWIAPARNHLLGIVGGVTWGIGASLNFVAAGLLGVPISYAIGQSAPLIAAAWGVFVWREFGGAPKPAWVALACMFMCYIAAIGLVAAAYQR